MPLETVKLEMDEPRPRPIEERFLDALDSARQLAIGQVRTPYHVMSVVSRVSPEGECSWFFKFYDLKKGELVSKVRVSGDGARVLEWI